MDQALAQFGTAGALIAAAAAAVKILFAREVKAHDQETARADRLEAELLKLNETVRTQYFTTLGDATRAIGDALAVVRKAP
jgi:hypothetical protein